MLDQYQAVDEMALDDMTLNKMMHCQIIQALTKQSL
jgi:hypothetical protein